MPERETIAEVDDAYGRVTNPQRYRRLHDEAHDVVDQLTARFVADRVSGLGVDDDLARRADVETVIRLSPSPPQAAPLTFALTRFPGLLVRFGRWYVEAYPACGCDTCDERPEDLVNHLRQQVRALVAGKFIETVTGGDSPWLMHDFVGGLGHTRGGRLLDPGEARAFGAPARVDWRPWRGRAGAEEAWEA